MERFVGPTTRNGIKREKLSIKNRWEEYEEV